MRRPLLSLTLAAASLAAFISTAQASPVLGSHVDSTTFNTALGSTSGWSYLGQSTSAFSGPLDATVIYRSSSFSDTFGYSRTNHTGLTETFSASDGVGSTDMINGYTPGYLAYFESTDGLLSFLDGNIQWSDGTSAGGILSAQGDIDIFRKGGSYALFYDDGGPSGLGDDGDYNDLAVRLDPVPEPASLGIMGLALAGFGFMRRKRA